MNNSVLHRAIHQGGVINADIRLYRRRIALDLDLNEHLFILAGGCDFAIKLTVLLWFVSVSAFLVCRGF